MVRIPRSPKQARAKKKFHAIVRAGAELFTVLPLGKVTCDLIAKKAHVSVGTVYAYFNNKEQVLLRVFAERYRKFGDQLMTVWKPDGEPKDTVEFMSHAIPLLAKHFQGEGHLFHSIEIMIPQDPEFLALRMEWEKVAIQLMEEGLKRTKRYSSQEKLQMDAFLLHRMVYGTLRLNLVYGFNHSPEKLVRHILDMLEPRLNP